VILEDTNEDGIDELIVFNGQNVVIHSFNGTTFVNAKSLSVTSGYTIDAISVGYLEASHSSKSADIFVLSHKNTSYEVGVFRYDQ
jgi:hypothetical protein